MLKLLTPPLVSVPVPHLSWSEPAAVETVQWVIVDALEIEEVVADELEPVEAAPQPIPTVWPWQNMLLVAWVAGSLGWLGVTVTRVARFRCVLADAQLAPIELQNQVEDLAGSS